MADLPEGWIDQLKRFLDHLPRTLAETHRLLTNNQILIGRTQGVGAIGPEEAVNYDFTGPNLRASGVAYDVRTAFPYSGIEQYEFDIPTGDNELAQARRIAAHFGATHHWQAPTACLVQLGIAGCDGRRNHHDLGVRRHGSQGLDQVDPRHLRHHQIKQD